VLRSPAEREQADQTGLLRDARIKPMLTGELEPVIASSVRGIARLDIGHRFSLH
jgi:hypothetical protein